MKFPFRARSLSSLVLLALLMAPGAVALAQVGNADSLVSVSFSGLRLNRTSNTFDTTATVKNSSADSTLAAPLSLLVTSISDPSVTLANPTGTTPGGIPFIDVPLPAGSLAPGRSIGNILLKFYNPKRIAFTYQTSVTAGINVPPGPAPAPTVYITSPANGTIFSSQPIHVVGTVSDPSAAVSVNGVTAAVSGGQFTADQVPLDRDGMQTLTVIATNASGATSQASVTIALDTTAPAVVIDSPADGSTTISSAVAIAGTVSDAITPTPTVTVNGVAATVANGQFIAMGIPLHAGANTITAAARDAAGNTGTTTLTVNQVAPVGPHLVIVSGQAQSGPISTTLPAPLVVELDDTNGSPLPDQPINFEVSRGDGTLVPSPPVAGQGPDRTLHLTSDANGQASVSFTLGSRTGAGNNRVQASIPGNPALVEFCATSLSDPPDHLSIIAMSSDQVGVVSRPLAAPFEAVVADAMGNPVPGVPVTFKVTQGGGNFVGSPTLTAKSGPDGIAQALLTLGPGAGPDNNVATATFAGQKDVPLEFTASGKVPGPMDGTTFKGIVLDNQNQPLNNATVSIQGTSVQTTTDALGRFLLSNVPPGSQRLFINGSTISDTLGRIFPNLEFDTNVISGVENSLPFPVYLPPLATGGNSVRTITGTVTSPIVLQMPGVPEATLTLLPGTVVSNAAGPASDSNPITVRFSPVNIDRVPMPPPNGGKFLLAFTTQPAGTHFNPPAAVCLPNAGAPPGAQIDIFSFDHAVGQFVPIGLATVSEDGSKLCSNPGYGIRSAGWGGCGAPPQPGTNCQNCAQIQLGFQIGSGGSTKIVDPFPTSPARIGVIVGDTLTFSGVLPAGVSLPNNDYTWTGQQSGTGPQISATFGSTGSSSETLQCAGTTRMASITTKDVGSLGENAWSLLHIPSALTAKSLSTEASAWAAANVTALGGGIHNGRADAARHAYWNLLMTVQLGASLALGASTAHENTGISQGDPHNETVMDLENNATGSSLASGFSTGSTRAAMQAAVIGTLNAGQLTILDSSALNTTNLTALLIPSNH